MYCILYEIPLKYEGLVDTKLIFVQVMALNMSQAITWTNDDPVS